MGHSDDLLSSKNLLWLIVVTVVIAVIVIVLFRHSEKEDKNGDGEHSWRDDVHTSDKQKRNILIGLIVAAGVIVAYWLYEHGSLSASTENHSMSVGRGGASARSQSARAGSPQARAAASTRGARSQSPFLTNEERSASIRSPTRGSLSSLSSE